MTTSLEERTLSTLTEDVKFQFDKIREVSSPGELDQKWKALTAEQPARFINTEDQSLRVDVLKNFRSLDVFLLDLPTSYGTRSPLNILRKYVSGWRRGQTQLLKDMYELMKEEGALPLLEKHPESTVGNPNLFSYKGYTYTFRWTRHYLFLNLFKKHIEPVLDSHFTCLDIGSSYGVFSNLLKKEFPGSHQVLLDFPEQLMLARYFLGIEFPEARIAGFKDVDSLEKIDRAFIEKYDFVLLPWYAYKKLQKDTLDVVSNFASLGEMRREWFDYYLKSEPFLSAKYFFTSNRFQSYPEYDTDLTILDYPLQDFKRLHFRISPYFLYYYKRKNFFFYEKEHYSSQYFEFIGERP